MSTRKDVAEYAGVSVATVSYVVNNTKNVTPAVRERVEEAIKVLDYRPNLVARGLVTKKTMHVAMFVNNLKNAYYAEMLEGAQSVASDYGYIVSIVMIDYSNQDEILKLIARGVDGVIIATSETEKMAQTIGKSIPFAKPGQKVRIDYDQAIVDVLSSLKQKGHEEIAYLSGLKISGKPHDRLLGTKKAMQFLGLKYNPKLVIDGNVNGDTDEEAGREATRRLLDSGEKFTAIIALNDLMAAGAITELAERGMKVPEDVSVVGCDNTMLSRYYVPQIATIDVEVFRIGQLLMRQLLSELNHQDMQDVTIHATYIERNSVNKKQC